MQSIKFDYDFNELDVKQIVEYIYFFEQTKIDNIEQVSQIIKNVILIKKFIVHKNNNLHIENIFTELLYLIDKFFFDVTDFLSNKIIDDLTTIDHPEKYISIIATLDDYLDDYYIQIKEKSIFKDLVEKINIKIFANKLLSDISNLEKDKLTMYFHNMYNK
jgi:hypothetical protein